MAELQRRSDPSRGKREPSEKPSGKKVGAKIRRELEEIRTGLGERNPDLELDLIPIFGRVGAVASLYRAYYERFLAGSGLTHTEYQVLGTLRGAGPRSPTQLAGSVRQTTAGMTKTLDRLARAGLVERRAHPSDRRRVEVVPTRSGGRLVDRLQRRELSAQQELLGTLGARDRARLAGLLDQIIEQLVDGMSEEAS